MFELKKEVLEQIVNKSTVETIESLYGIETIFEFDAKQVIVITQKDCTNSGLLLDVIETENNKRGFILKKNYEVKYNSPLDRVHIETLVPQVVSALNIFLKDKVTHIWFDYGVEIYDLHINFKTLSDDEYVDMYLKIKDVCLFENYMFNGLDFTKVVGKEIVDSLIVTINEVKEQRKDKN